MPVEPGSVTHCTAQAAIAASSALPPARMISIAVWVESVWLVAAIAFIAVQNIRRPIQKLGRGAVQYTA